MLGLVLFGGKIVAQSLQVHLLFPVRCLACVLNLQVVAREMVWQSKPRSQQVLSGNAGKNRTAHAQLVPIILVPLISSVLDCPKLLLPIHFQGPELQPEKYFSGPEKCDQIPPRPQGPEKHFRAAQKVARKWKFAPEARGRSSRKRRCLTAHVKL